MVQGARTDGQHDVVKRGHNYRRRCSLRRSDSGAEAAPYTTRAQPLPAQPAGWLPARHPSKNMIKVGSEPFRRLERDCGSGRKLEGLRP